MLITVTTTSQTLNTILSTGQKDIAKTTNSNNGRNHKMIIQNLGNQDIYIDFGQVASLSAGLKIVTNGIFTFNDMTFNDLNLIANGVNNTNIRILFN